MKLVVDTNVPIVANGMASPQATPECVSTCVQYISDFSDEKHILILDWERHILNEYGHKLSSDGQPGIGDAFLKWVLTNQGNSQRCEFVHITEHPNRGFEEFPDDPDLLKFDPSDRKFVATAQAHPDYPPILNAVDTDWWHYRSSFRKHGIHIEFLCPELMT